MVARTQPRIAPLSLANKQPQTWRKNKQRFDGQQTITKQQQMCFISFILNSNFPFLNLIFYDFCLVGFVADVVVAAAAADVVAVVVSRYQMAGGAFRNSFHFPLFNDYHDPFVIQLTRQQLRAGWSNFGQRGTSATWWSDRPIKQTQPPPNNNNQLGN